jgi:2-keto-4-pentenoate hydratase/2-oxohepta-3-ene-1,7-dioic acid hydratase in catechol pathway
VRSSSRVRRSQGHVADPLRSRADSLPAADSRPEKFLCVGKNYRSHLDELKRTNLIREMPNEPTGFIKLNAALTDTTATWSPPTDVSTSTTSRAGVRDRQAAFRGQRADAHSRTSSGITLLNDLTCRDTQQREVASGSRFWTAKNAPGFGPVGPYVITMDEVRDPYDLCSPAA